MLPMSVAGGRNGDDEGERETFPSPSEIDRRANTIRMMILLVFLLVFIDISSVPTTQTQNGVDGISSKAAASATKTTMNRNGTHVGAITLADFDKRVNEMTSEVGKLEIPQNVSGLYRGDWRSPNHKFQSGVLPLYPSLQARTKSGPADSRALEPSSGRLLLTIKSSKVPGLSDLTFVFGIARLFGASLQDNDMVVPLKGVFVRSNGELTLMTSYDPNEHLFLEVPPSRPSNGTGTARRKLRQVRRSNYRFDSKEKKTGEGYVAKTIRRIASYWGITETTRAIDDNEAFNFSVESVLKELTRSVMEKEEVGKHEVDTGHHHRHRHHYSSGNRRRRLQEGYPANPTSRSLPQMKSGSRNASVTIQTVPVNLGLRQGLVYLTQNIQIAFKYANRSATFGRNLSSDDGILYHSQGVGSSENKVLVSELGRNEVSSNFKSLQTLIANTAPRSGVPLCPMLFKFRIDSDSRGEPNHKSEVALVPGESMQAEHFVSSVESESQNDDETGETFAKGIEGFALSHSCGLNMTMAATSYQIDTEVLSRKAAVYSLIATVMCAIQIAVLVMQMRYSQAQAIASRMSIMAICSNAVLDALISVGHLMLSASVPGMFLHHFMWISVLKLFFFCVFEMRTVVSVYQARHAQELATEGWQGLRRRLASLHLRFYAAVFLGLFVSLSLLDRPIVLVFLLYSMWVPQIIWNAYNGTRKALLPAYLYGTSATRLFIPLYFYGCPKNFLHYIIVDETSFVPQFLPCLAVVLWMGVQVAVLVAQDKFGSRHFLPKSWFPEKYDYYRPIPESALEHVPVDEVADIESSSSRENSEGGNSGGGTSSLPDCIICYDKVPSAYGEYMIAPCDHLFCTTCLKQWLEVKNECPVCRASLPAVED